MSEPVSRRAFVCGGCALVAAGCTPSGVGVPPPPGSSGDTSDPGTTAPSTTEVAYPCGQVVPTSAGRAALSLSDYPDLEQVGGWVGVSVGGREIVVAHVEEGCYSAILRACTHEGVAINYRPERFQFVCPRHGAIYAVDGTKVAGPQPAGLPVYPAAREGDTIWVDVTA